MCRYSISDQDEVLFRLRLLRSTNQREIKTFDFPWGTFDYLSAGNLAAQYREIFILRQYAFECEHACPVTVDCGGNVGLSVVWFKRHYPQSKVIVYEADPEVAQVLINNVTRLGLSDVNVNPVAVWTSHGTMGFQQRGPDSGSLSTSASCSIATIRLAENLPAHVDLLKMDIEGGEFEVLKDLYETNALRRVERLVVECHVTVDVLDDLVRLLAMIRECDMHFVIGSAYPKTRLLDRTLSTPFSGVAGSQFLLELYAWKKKNASFNVFFNCSESPFAVNAEIVTILCCFLSNV